MLTQILASVCLLSGVLGQQQQLPGVTDTWPYQSYKTTNLTIPAWNVTKTGKTETGYIFYGQVDILSTKDLPES